MTAPRDTKTGQRRGTPRTAQPEPVPTFSPEIQARMMAALLEVTEEEEKNKQDQPLPKPQPTKRANAKPKGKSAAIRNNVTKNAGGDGAGGTATAPTEGPVRVLWPGGPNADLGMRPLPKAYQDQSLIGIQYLRSVVDNEEADPILRQAAAQKLVVIEKGSVDKAGEEEQLHRRPRTRIQREIAQLWEQVRAEGIVKDGVGVP